MNLACRDDADPESFELLVAAGARIDERAKLSGLAKVIKRVSKVAAFFGSVKMRGMARAFKLATEAGRLAYTARPMAISKTAVASSPLLDISK